MHEAAAVKAASGIGDRLTIRIPAASDLPMIEPVMAEAYAVKAAAEVGICPPIAAIGKAVEPGTGRP
jgi:CO/xanthine dehydrogenase Mo-binding subunit